MGSKSRGTKPETEGGTKPFNNPFGALGGLRSDLPQGTSPAPEPEKIAKGPARAVVRLERKGHGGKEVTAIEKLELPAAQLETWLKELKHSLGCGGALVGDAIHLQGDQRERLPALLEKRGVRKVTVG